MPFPIPPRQSLPDIYVTGRAHDTVLLFKPMTKAAEEHLRENVAEDAQWLGNGVAVENRYVNDLAERLVDAGFTIRARGWVR